MHQLFRQTRWQLTTWYAGMIASILAVCGLGFYEAIAHAHRITVDRELQSVASTLHNTLKSILQQPGKLTSQVNEVVPLVCFGNTNCLKVGSSTQQLEIIAQDNYYFYFLNNSQQIIATGGIQLEEIKSTSIIFEPRLVTIEAKTGVRYRQITLKLHTRNNQDWGYLQIGRSLQDFDSYVANIKWIILLGLPIVTVLVMVSGWWLAGRAMQPVYQSYRQMQQFTADAAHELRTPLAATRATVESTLMLPNLSESEARETLETVNRQNKRLGNLVADLLMLSRLDRQLNLSTDTITNQERVNLPDLVADVTEELAALALANQIQLSKEVRVLDSLEISGNSEQLYRLVTNLIINAIQYTSAKGKVKVTLERDNNLALISVQDTGIGIYPGEQKQIFERFYRVDKARSRHSGGSGLGLSIAMAIAKAHQGEIKVVSELGKGSKFVVTLHLT